MAAARRCLPLPAAAARWCAAGLQASRLSASRGRIWIAIPPSAILPLVPSLLRSACSGRPRPRRLRAGALPGAPRPDPARRGSRTLGKEPGVWTSERSVSCHSLPLNPQSDLGRRCARWAGGTTAGGGLLPADSPMAPTPLPRKQHQSADSPQGVVCRSPESDGAQEWLNWKTAFSGERNVEIWETKSECIVHFGGAEADTSRVLTPLLAEPLEP